MKSILLACTGVIAIGISGCNKVSENDFVSEIKAEIDGKWQCVSEFDKFPFYLASEQRDSGGKEMLATAEFFEGIGFLKSTPALVDIGLGKFFAKDGFGYDLTPKGKKNFQQSEDRSQMGFCYGKTKFVKVENFTEPTNDNGRKSSSVTYQWEATDKPDWFESYSKFIKENPDFSAPNFVKGKPQFGRMDMVLTNKGWLRSE
ncbi:hypothetical protein [Deinococcus sp.]|uniref:hypothetical protein n=1 Tax=Deinococcus sp. TaxID=47478 RepID=UPI003B5A5F16